MLSQLDRRCSSAQVLESDLLVSVAGGKNLSRHFAVIIELGHGSFMMFSPLSELSVLAIQVASTAKISAAVFICMFDFLVVPGW